MTMTSVLQLLLLPVLLFLLDTQTLCNRIVPVASALSAAVSGGGSGTAGSKRSTSNTGAGPLSASLIGWDRLAGKRILVVGGSGRVGGSVTTQLVSRGANVTVGGTKRSSFLASQARWQHQFPHHRDALAAVSFVSVDREQPETLMRVLLSQKTREDRQSTTKDSDTSLSEATEAVYDLVVHTAGPFQGKALTPNGVLQASIEACIPYIDVCDDYETAVAARDAWGDTALANTVPCILSTGCWPGVSSLMAKQLVTKAQIEHPHIDPRDLSLRFSFFTAGSGGAGVTLLVATFLILAEPALTIVRGQRRKVPAMADYTTVSFGPVVGHRAVAPLNLLETASLHNTLGVGSVSSWFGTAPNVWNTLLGLMAKLPSALLANEEIMRRLSVFSMPIVRAVDYLAGATNAMRCDLSYSPDTTTPSSGSSLSWTTTALYGHENLEPCVGECVAAFCCALLTPGRVPAGVWFPEQAIAAGDDTLAVLNLASESAHTKTW